MTEDIKELIAKRSSIKGRVTKFKNNLDILDTLEIISPLELSKLAMKLSKFEAIFIEYDEVQNQIEILNIDKQDAELAIRDLVESDFYHCISFAKSLMEKNNTPIPSHEPTSQHSHHHSCCHNNSRDFNNPLGFRLPEIKISPFEGSHRKWIEFKEIFTSLVHQYDRIKNIHKFTYLNSYLQGEAAHVISNLEISDKNYQEAWKLLCERYDNKLQLINNYLKSLFSLESVRENDKSLRFLVDHVTKNLRALNSLGLPTDKWDVLIIYHVSNKLDNATYFKWEDHRNHLPEIPTLDQFFSFLKSRADVLETSFQRSKQDKSEKYKHNPTYSQRQPQTKALVTTSPNKINPSPSSDKPQCASCNGTHHVFQCADFKDKTVDERIQLVTSHNLRHNCLKTSHKAAQCKLLGSCRFCRERHNSLLCKSMDSEHTLTKAQKKSDKSQPSEEEAATKIQAVFRGHQSRKSMSMKAVKQQQPPAAKKPEPEPTKAELEAEFRPDDKELCHAATKIQASFRGHQARKEVDAAEAEKKRQEQQDKEDIEKIDLGDPDLNKAATKIQASFRGHKVRKDTN